MQITNLTLKPKLGTWHDVEKALGTVNHEKTQLAEKLKDAESAAKALRLV